MSLIDNLGEISRLIDGYITANGAYCFAGDSVILNRPIPTDEAAAVKAAADKLGVACLTVGARDLLFSDPTKKLWSILQRILNVKEQPADLPAETLSGQGIIQMTVFATVGQEPQILADAPHCISSRWYPAFTDITSDGADKGKGIDTMAAHFGFSIGETMAFGDGGNDISMLRKAGIGVAMGNAAPDVQAEARYITDSVDDNGIERALKHFRII